VLAGALAAAASLTYAAPAGACGGKPYAYAGVSATTRAYGVAAALTALATPRVGNGHVAAWVGVGGPGMGPNGSDEWIQVGLSGFAGGSTSVYYEVARPGGAPLYTEVEANLRPGDGRRVAVLETRARRDWWRVWVDGRAVGRPIFLPGSHGSWTPMATGESWTTGGGRCNGYQYRFDGVSVARSPGGSWAALGDHYAFSDAGYRLVGRSPSTFVASSATGSRPRRELVSVRR
jgi:hypothetical protein